MAKVYGPAMSFDATGKLAKSIVFSDWKGIGYVRKYTIPANPKSTAQVSHRGLFAYVHDIYKWLPTYVQLPWVTYSKGKPLTPMNVWQSKNMKGIGTAGNNDNLLFSTPVNGGPALTGVTYTAGATKITVAADDPVLPTGWAVNSFFGVCTPEVTSFAETEPVLVFGTNMAVLGSPYTVDITGLTTGTAYVVGAGFTYTRADGSIAANGAASGKVTPT